MKLYKYLILNIFLITCAHARYLPIAKAGLDRWYDDQTSLRTYLLSFPRSGNTWLRYCLEVLTKRPTLEKMEEVILDYNRPLGFSFPEVGTDFEKSPIWKMHTIDWFNNKFQSYHPDQETLIFVLRNPKEVISRQCGTINVKMLKDKNHFQQHYFINLEIFHHWNPDKRHLIYYEDLMENPQETLRELLLFLNEDPSAVDEFMQHYKEHKAKSLKIYQSFSTSVTKGNSMTHHSKKIHHTERIAIDSFIKATYPELWNNYLSRYAEPA